MKSSRGSCYGGYMQLSFNTRVANSLRQALGKRKIEDYTQIAISVLLELERAFQPIEERIVRPVEPRFLRVQAWVIKLIKEIVEAFLTPTENWPLQKSLERHIPYGEAGTALLEGNRSNAA